MRRLLCLLTLLAGAAAAADFTGDGRADLVWRDAGGQPVFWTMNGTGRSARTVLARPRDAAWSLAATADFNGDARDELLWLRVDGRIEVWLTSNGSASTVYAFGLQVPATHRFLGTGKFDADNRADVIWEVREPGAQRLIVWHMSGADVTSFNAQFIAPQPDWQRLGVGDNNGDGLADVLWRRSDGRIEAWWLSGNNVLSVQQSTDPVPAGYSLAAAGDLDGDARMDLLWRDGNGQFVAWLMNGVTHLAAPLSGERIFGSGFDTASALPALSPLAGGDWQVLDIADFDDDGKNDIAAVDPLGQVTVLLLDGTKVRAANQLAADNDMPYPGRRGWSLPPGRPSVIRHIDSPGEIDVSWSTMPGDGTYLLHVSDQRDPAHTGVTTTNPANPTVLNAPTNTPTPLRYFAVSVDNHGLISPPSRDAYALDFEPTELNYWGALSLADFDGDGCIDVIGGHNDCAGGFTTRSEASMGLGALYGPGRAWRDLRFGDLDGNGIADAIGNVYAPITDSASQALMFRGLGNGQYQLDAAFGTLAIRGYGETIVFADFDNDGDLDVFLPHYTHNSANEHNWLLLNDGTGHFTDIADAAGVAMRNWPGSVRVEGAQAVDIDDDGWLDLYVGSHLFINQGTAGGLHFVDRHDERNLPLQFEEGAKFVDWNNDGLLDLLTQHPFLGPSLHIDIGTGYYGDYGAMPARYWNNSYGMNAGDIDGDGKTDLILGGGCGDSAEIRDGNCFDANSLHALPRLYLQRAGQSVEAFLYDDGRVASQRTWNDLQSLGDLEGNGSIDVVTRFTGGPGITLLQQQATDEQVIVVRVLGASGQENQQGRVVRVTPLARPDFVMTQVVDGGSGYMSNSPYALTFATPEPGQYRVDVRFDHGTVSALVRGGERVVFKRGGTIEIAPIH